MTYFCVLLIFFGFCGCFGNQKDIGYGNRYGGYGNYGPMQYYSIVGSDYREGKEYIWRPCSLDDYGCMGHFLSLNSQCIPTHGYTPDPIRLPVEKFYFPTASMTITDLDARVRGFKNAKISEFYVNKATDNVVIAVSIPTYNYSSNGFFTYQRTSKEPIALGDFSTFEIDNTILTAAIPKVPNLRLDMADIHANISNTLPRYYIGPGASKSNDPAVISGMVKFEANVVQAVREAFILHSYFLMSAFIQNEICDFGIDSYENYNGYLAFRRGCSRD